MPAGAPSLLFSFNYIYNKSMANENNNLTPKQTLIESLKRVLRELWASASTTFATKAEVDAKFSEFAGPTYDAGRECVVFPTTSKVHYDAERECVVFG